MTRDTLQTNELNFCRREFLNSLFPSVKASRRVTSCKIAEPSAVRKKILYFSFFCLLAGCTVNNQQFDLQTFLNNLAISYAAIEKLVTAWAYLTGAVFVAGAIFQLKVYGEMRTMMSGEHTIMRPITYLLVGTGLMYLPGTFHSLMASTFGNPNTSPLSWSNLTSIGIYGYKLAITPALLGLMKLVGLISFVRGWMMLVRLADRGGQPVFGKALTHIIGGLLLINIVGTGNLLWNLITVG